MYHPGVAPSFPNFRSTASCSGFRRVLDGARYRSVARVASPLFLHARRNLAGSSPNGRLSRRCGGCSRARAMRCRPRRKRAKIASRVISASAPGRTPGMAGSLRTISAPITMTGNRARRLYPATAPSPREGIGRHAPAAEPSGDAPQDLQRGRDRSANGRPQRRAGTESSVDSPLEGTGFELSSR